jgi:hypothetical protein
MKSPDGLTIIYDEKGEVDHLICDHCGERVEPGIVTISEHYVKCQGTLDLRRVPRLTAFSLKSIFGRF